MTRSMMELLKEAVTNAFLDVISGTLIFIVAIVLVVLALLFGRQDHKGKPPFYGS